MACFEVFALPHGRSAAYVLDVQADLLSDLATRAVVPLLAAATAPKPVARLNPVFEIGEQEFVMATQFIASVPLRELKRVVLSLAARRDEIVAALDMLFVGF